MESIRFTGLASGMDTQSIVDSMMKAERMPLDRVKQNKQVLEWQRDDYREMNKLLNEFDQFIFDGIFRQSNMLTRNATSSNSDFVTATAGSEAGNVSYDIKNVQLATAASIQSSKGISKTIDPDKPLTAAEKIDPTQSLWSQRSKFGEGLKFIEEAEMTSNKFTIPEAGESEFQLTKGAITNSSIEIKIDGTKYTGAIEELPKSGTLDPDKIYVDYNTGKMMFGTALTKDQSLEVNFKSNNLEFNIETYNEDSSENKNDFKFSGATSLNSVFSEINKSNVGVNLFYDTGSDKVVAQRKETGNLSKGEPSISIKFTGASADFFTKSLNLTTEKAGTNAKFNINGLDTERTSNTFTMNDVTFTLKKNSTAGESSSINVKSDTDAVYKTIKDFVDKYNEVIGKINGELTEERFKTFAPLTDEQRGAMGEKDIEKWEEKAKSGMLRRDSLLSSGLGSMRTDMYAEVTANATTLTDKKYNQLSEIGITTTKNYLDRGKLEIDEKKLKAALEDNPEAVYQLFMADGTKHNEKGIARRLRDSISNTMEKIEAKAGNTFKTEHNYSMGKDLLRMKSDIDRWEERLKMKEERYWSQFNAMEKAMQQLNNQSSQLLAQLGMGGQ